MFAVVLVPTGPGWHARAAEPILPLAVRTAAAAAAVCCPGVLAGEGDACGTPAPRASHPNTHSLTGLLHDLRRLYPVLHARCEGGSHALLGGRQNALFGGARGGGGRGAGG